LCWVEAIEESLHGQQNGKEYARDLEFAIFPRFGRKP